MSPRKPPSEPSNPRKDAVLKDYDDQMLQILAQICPNPLELPAFIMQAKLNRTIIGIIVDLSLQLSDWMDNREK